ncbi:MAG: hypothetical protein IT434_13170 [Phycisphaerales bacterium]|jgi:ABC-type hemin transport system substrate-binding protein|nr:hypothetical protein [Phycisphaerales bacterium]
MNSRAAPITLALLTLAAAATILFYSLRPTNINNAATGAAPPAHAVETPTAKPPPRIAVLSPALAVMLSDLGAAPSIVARHGYDMILDKSLPSCGDQSGIDYESLLSVRPTHVLIEWGSRPLPERLVELSASHAWNVRAFTLLSLDDVTRSLVELSTTLKDARLDVSERSAALAATLGDSTRPRPDLARLDGVLLLMSVRPPAALGPGSVHHEILTRLGATAALTKPSPYVELDTEDVRHLAPGVIVLVTPRAAGAAPVAKDTPEARRLLLGPLSALDIPAVQSDRIIVIDDPLALLPTTRLADFAKQLGDRLEALAR